MSSYAIELLSAAHDRANFTSGLESVDRYFREVARGHLEKGVSITRVLVEPDALAPKPVFGFKPVSTGSLRLFLPAKSLGTGIPIPRE